MDATDKPVTSHELRQLALKACHGAPIHVRKWGAGGESLLITDMVRGATFHVFDLDTQFARRQLRRVLTALIAEMGS
jgi:hypothetical protein